VRSRQSLCVICQDRTQCNIHGELLSLIRHLFPYTLQHRRTSVRLFPPFSTHVSYTIWLFLCLYFYQQILIIRSFKLSVYGHKPYRTYISQNGPLKTLINTADLKAKHSVDSASACVVTSVRLMEYDIQIRIKQNTPALDYVHLSSPPNTDDWSVVILPLLSLVFISISLFLGVCTPYTKGGY
jgi:hypothetical protein